MVFFSAFSFSAHSPLVLTSTFFVFGKPFYYPALPAAVFPQADGAFAAFALSSHDCNPSLKMSVKNSSTISAARFCISPVVWVYPCRLKGPERLLEGERVGDRVRGHALRTGLPVDAGSPPA